MYLGEMRCYGGGFGVRKGLQQRIWGKLGAIGVDLGAMRCYRDFGEIGCCRGGFGRSEGLQRWIWGREG